MFGLAREKRDYYKCTVDTIRWAEVNGISKSTIGAVSEESEDDTMLTISRSCFGSLLHGVFFSLVISFLCVNYLTSLCFCNRYRSLKLDELMKKHRKGFFFCQFFSLSTMVFVYRAWKVEEKSGCQREVDFSSNGFKIPFVIKFLRRAESLLRLSALRPLVNLRVRPTT